MRRWVGMMAALMLTGPAAAIAVGPPEPVVEWAAPERPNIVALGSVDGMLPAVPTNSRAFMAGLREALESRSEWISHAGRAAGLLAVEALHRQSGDLGSDTRLRIDRAVRKRLVIIQSGP